MSAPTTIVVTNTFCSVSPEPHVVRKLDELTSYKVEGAQFSPAFKHGLWDGKEHLVQRSRRTDKYIFPTGVLPEILKSELADELKLVDARRRPAECKPSEWIGPEPRDYQRDAVDAALADRGLLTGRGLLHLPIRAGKTLLSALTIHRLGVRTLFVVPSDILLMQTVAAFRSFISGLSVGIIGAGQWEPGWITVATVQTLIARKAEAQAYLSTVDALFQDEAHHLDAPEWRKPILTCDAYWKIGLSATLFFNKDLPSERSAIWMRAATGPILYKLSMKRLMDLGHLVAPDIFIYPVSEPSDFSARSSYQAAYDAMIVKSEYRNKAIADLAEQAVRRGYRVLVDTGRLKQLARIVEMLRARGIVVKAVTGKTPPGSRMEILSAFRRREVQCVVGTVLGEGVDLPELEVVINAEAMKSKTAVIQRLRNLTECAGKSRAILCDFADSTHPTLAKHSLERLKLYRGIRGFKVRQGNIVDGRFLFES